MILNAVRVARILKSSGLDPRRIASDPKLFDEACKTVHRAIPFPLRRKIDEASIRHLVEAACHQASRDSIPGAEQSVG
jgi:hypothetical protein